MPVVRPLGVEQQVLDPGPAINSPPHLPIEAEWKAQSRLWGHAFHPMCSYLGSFPAALAHAFIERWSRPGDVVLDPFAGRGTVPLQATATRRIGVGSDLNPLAHILTAAKVDPPTRSALAARLADLRVGWTGAGVGLERMARSAIDDPEQAIIPAPLRSRDTFEPWPTEVAPLFHARTLAQLIFLRAALDTNERTDRFLAAATTGILHGRSVGYLSTSMPNVFSLAPRFARRSLQTAAPDRDVFALLSAKVARLYRDGVPPGRGIALPADARTGGPAIVDSLRERGLPERARLVVTSPPYLGVVRYGAANWLRLWFLGHDAAAVDGALWSSGRVLDYAAFIGMVLSSLEPTLADDAVIVLVIGDVATDRGRARPADRSLAESVWAMAAQPLGYRLVGIGADAIAQDRKLTRIWGDEAGRATDTTASWSSLRRSAGGGALQPVSRGQSTGRHDGPRARLKGPARCLYSAGMRQMYHPDDLASMDPLVLMKNLDHVRMTSRRLSYVLQQQVHLYVPEANQLRDEIDRYVEAERQIEAELGRRQIRA